jgi:hypothetical protein
MNRKGDSEAEDFQRQLYSDYTGRLSLPEQYLYIHRNLAKTVVPSDTAQNAVFVIGAYPRAR